MDYLNIVLQNWYIVLAAFVLSYLLGSINTAVIVTKIVTMGKGDIREMGSKNAGFTNVLRSVGKVPAIVTIVCDLLKSVIAVLIGGIIFSMISTGHMYQSGFIMAGKYLCGFLCILGHSYPIYFNFKGGKGIVAAAGMMIVADWRVFLLVLATFLIVFICSKIISLSSITGAVMFPVYTFIITYLVDCVSAGTQHPYFSILCTVAALIMAFFVIIKHKDNIKRLAKGEEKKITAKK